MLELSQKDPLVNHKIDLAMLTRFSVTNSWCLRCKATARNLSRAMAEIVKKDAVARKYVESMFTVRADGHKKSKL